MKFIPILIAGFTLTGAFTSCKKDPVSSQCDTCKTDTTHHSCDTCNLNKDSLAHAFVWTEYIDKMPGESNPTGVWVFGENDIYINGTYLWHFDGINFTRMSIISKQTGIGFDLAGFNNFAFSKTDFWLVGGSIALHTTDGKNADDNRPGGVLTACWGTSSSDMFFVGNGGLIYHYNGTKFDTMTSNTTKNLGSVWGTSHNDVWATGYNSSTDESILLHYDGNAWTEDQFSTSGKVKQYGIGTVWACDSSGHSIAVIAGTKVFHKTDNGPWRPDTSDLGNSLGSGSYVGIGAFGGTATDIFAVGGWGFVAHWNGKTWKKYNQFFDYSNSNYGAGGFSMNGNTACVIGIKSGASWVLVGQRSQ